jgi:hypothetical protein
MLSPGEKKQEENNKMIPMEFDGDGDPKGEGFLDEFQDNGDDDNDNGPFLLSSFSVSKAKRTSAHGNLFRKRHVLFGIIFVTLGFVAIAFLPIGTPVLEFRLDESYYSHSHYSAAASNQTFKIMQITDIHLGEAEYTDWGPRQDEKTFRLLESIFEHEPDCDLIVLGGDQLTANNCLGNCTKYYGILGRFLSRYDVPWATIMGNHDDMPFEVEDGSGTTIPHSYTRRDLLKVDQRFALSLSQASKAGTVTGVTNYVVDVLDPITQQPALQIFFLDSGGGSMKEAITDDQIQWFREQAGVGSDDQTPPQIPAVAFQHIPTWQYEYKDGYCVGYQGEGVAELEYDAGIVDAMVESGRFHFLAVGHNHGNDYCCSYRNSNGNGNNKNDDDSAANDDDFFLCYGRHSGYGGYGSWDRGVRIYELSLTADDETSDGETTKEFTWRTWVSDKKSMPPTVPLATLAMSWGAGSG